MSLAKLSWSAASAFQVLTLSTHTHSNFSLVLDKALVCGTGRWTFKNPLAFAEAVKKHSGRTAAIISSKTQIYRGAPIFSKSISLSLSFTHPLPPPLPPRSKRGGEAARMNKSDHYGQRKNNKPWRWCCDPTYKCFERTGRRRADIIAGWGHTPAESEQKIKKLR